MERRDFIKSGCGYCVALATIGALGMLAEGCKPSGLIYNTKLTGGIISIPAEEMADKKILVIRTPQIEYDLLLVKEDEGAFHALAMLCTHRQQPLEATSTGLVCNEHGSRFDLNGNVTKDPAIKPLTKFKAEMKKNEIFIYFV